MSRPKIPPLADVIALAAHTDCRVSIKDLTRMHKNGAFSERVVDLLWPKAKKITKAAYMGLTRYESKPCQKCGCTRRIVSSRSCEQCHVAHCKEWRSQNVEIVIPKKRQYYHENREYFRLYKLAKRQLAREQAA